MKDSEIYRKAARLLERRGKSVWNGSVIQYACEAIDTAIGLHSNGHCAKCKAMRELFDNGTHYTAWLSGVSSDSHDEEEDRDGRVLALCFMACIAEDAE